MGHQPESACIFCRIAAGEIPADIVRETDEAIAFRDINPQAPVHILVIPRRHVSTVNDLAPTDRELLGSMVTLARDLARAEGIADDGYRLVVNCGAQAGQTVFHLHLHLLGGRHLAWPPG